MEVGSDSCLNSVVRYEKKILTIHPPSLPSHSHSLSDSPTATAAHTDTDTYTTIIVKATVSPLTYSRCLPLPQPFVPHPPHFHRCDGSWGLAVVHKDRPDEIVVACNGSPMVFILTS